MIDAEILRKRRAKLAEKLDDNEAVLIYANSQQNYPGYFRQDNNFLYLTGLETPNAVFVMTKKNGNTLAEVFIEKNNSDREVWDGKKLGLNEAKKISGIEKVSYLEELPTRLYYHLYLVKKCAVNYEDGILFQTLSRKQQYVADLRDRYPRIIWEDLEQLITPLRLYKDEWEIKQIEKAIGATSNAIDRMMTAARVGMYEYELEAILYHQTLSEGLPHMGFKPIVAAGKNATTLHYEKNNCQISTDEMILLDIGAACNNYSADISRTFPVAEDFTPRQKAVYQEVLEVQKQIIEMVRPGITMPELNSKAADMIAEALLRLKLIDSKDDYREYYMHSVSHHLGMDAHDVGGRESTLEEGCVITVEPGIYIAAENIGIRIEDDILVTENGNRNLSREIPKEIDELIAIRQKALAKEKR